MLLSDEGCIVVVGVSISLNKRFFVSGVVTVSFALMSMLLFLSVSSGVFVVVSGIAVTPVSSGIAVTPVSSRVFVDVSGTAVTPSPLESFVVSNLFVGLSRKHTTPSFAVS